MAQLLLPVERWSRRVLIGVPSFINEVGPWRRITSIGCMYFTYQLLGFVWAFLTISYSNSAMAIGETLGGKMRDLSWGVPGKLPRKFATFLCMYYTFRRLSKFASSIAAVAWDSSHDFPRISKEMTRILNHRPMVVVTGFLPQMALATLLLVVPISCDGLHCRGSGDLGEDLASLPDYDIPLIVKAKLCWLAGSEQHEAIWSCLKLLLRVGLVAYVHFLLHMFPQGLQPLYDRGDRMRVGLNIAAGTCIIITITAWGIGLFASAKHVPEAWLESISVLPVWCWSALIVSLVMLLLTTGSSHQVFTNETMRECLSSNRGTCVLACFFMLGLRGLLYQMGLMKIAQEFTVMSFLGPASYVLQYNVVHVCCSLSIPIVLLGGPFMLALSAVLCHFSSFGGPATVATVAVHLYAKLLKFFGCYKCATNLPCSVHEQRPARTRSPSYSPQARSPSYSPQMTPDSGSPTQNGSTRRTVSTFFKPGGNSGAEMTLGGAKGVKHSYSMRVSLPPISSGQSSASSDIAHVPSDGLSSLPSESSQNTSWPLGIMSAPINWFSSLRGNRQVNMGEHGESLPSPLSPPRRRMMRLQSSHRVFLVPPEDGSPTRGRTMSTVLNTAGTSQANKFIMRGTLRVMVWISSLFLLFMGGLRVLSQLQSQNAWYPELIDWSKTTEGDLVIDHAIVTNTVLKTKGKLQLQTPEYATCSLKWHGFSLFDYSLLSELAYFAPSSQPGILKEFFPKDHKKLKLKVPHFDSMKGAPPFMDIYAKDEDLTIIAIRGSDLGRMNDFIEDIKMWTEPVAFHVILGNLFPTIRFWPDSFASLMIAWMHDALYAFGLQSEAEYYRPLLQYVEEEVLPRGGNVVITGHSLGGGLARIVAAAVKVPCITFSPPGIAQSYRKFRAHSVRKVGLDKDNLHHRSVAVVPDMDFVTKVDSQTGLTQHIACRTEEKAAQFSCHLLEGTICELLNHCGDHRGRFTGCSFVFDVHRIAPAAVDFLRAQGYMSRLSGAFTASCVLLLILAMIYLPNILDSRF